MEMQYIKNARISNIHALQDAIGIQQTPFEVLNQHTYEELGVLQDDLVKKYNKKVRG